MYAPGSPGFPLLAVALLTADLTLLGMNFRVSSIGSLYPG